MFRLGTFRLISIGEFLKLIILMIDRVVREMKLIFFLSLLRLGKGGHRKRFCFKIDRLLRINF